jgi:hypothetical protein
MNDRLLDLVENVEVVLHARSLLRTKGPHFRIVHRFRVPGADCAAGEEIVAAFLLVAGQEYAISLGGAMLILFDYLAHHSRLPQSATQIVMGMKSDPFYQEHGSNACRHPALAKHVSLSAVKVYIQRIRTALEKALREAGISIDPYQILASEDTQSNRRTYRLKGSFEWTHIDHPRCHDGA